MACAWIKLLVMMLSRCVPIYCRQARVAVHHALLGPFLVQTVQMVVQFLAKLFSPVVVQRQVPDFVRTVCSVARGGSTGGVLGQGYGHCDRCRDPDSVNCLEVPPIRSCCSSMVVDIPVFTQRRTWNLDII